MQKREFNRGILAEIRLSKSADDKPAVIPSAPNPVPESIAPSVGGTVAPNVTNSPALPTQAQAPDAIAGPNITGDNVANPVVSSSPAPFTPNISPNITKILFPQIQKSYANYPVEDWPKHIQQDREALKSPSLSYILGSQGRANPFLSTAKSYMGSNITSPLKAWKELQDASNSLGAFAKAPPDDAMFSEWAKKDPNAGKFWEDTTHKAVDDKVNSFNSLGDIYDAATHLNENDGKNSFMNAALKDPKLKSYAINKTMSRGGQLLGGWLKDNWGKLAIGVGGTAALAYILKQMSSSNENTNQAPQQARQESNAPRFL